jgi:novel protein kinase C epsilon type
VLEFESGGNMVRELEKVQTFNEKIVQFYAAEITLALEFLHRQGILHR